MTDLLTPDRWQRVKTLFHELVEMETRYWQTYLDTACSDDLVVRRQVERLVAQLESSGPIQGPILQWTGSAETIFSTGDTINGRFEVIRFIGRGGMGEVYEVVDRIGGTRDALKTIRSGMDGDPHLRAQFRREMQIARTVTHENVCRIHDLFEAEIDMGVAGLQRQIMFLTMALVRGPSLAEWLAENGPLPAERALTLLRQIAAGLDAAHQKGVIHRDLKTSNIMLEAAENGQSTAVLTDFGLACWKTAAAVSGEESPLGTPAYMAPEQLEGGPVSPATDIFALGVVLFEMVTGKRPFAESGTVSGARRRALSTPVNPRVYAPDLPERWAVAIMQCLAYEPQARFANVAELLKALDVPARHTSRRWLIATGVTAAGGAVVWQWLGKRAPSPVTSIAVLPFENLSTDTEVGYFADGLRDELIPMLTRFPGLRVAAPTSSARFRAATDAKEAGARLKVGTVLTGAVMKSGDRVNVTARLINVADGTWLWSGNYEQSARSLSQIRIDLCLAIAGELQPRLPHTQLAGMATPQTSNSEAYRLYLLGKHHATYRTETGLKRSIQYLNESAARDPNFALSYAALSEAYSLLAGQPDCPPGVYLAKGEEAARRALALDRRLGEAHASLGLSYQWFHWDWSSAEREFQTAIEMNRSLAIAHYRYSGLLSDRCRHEEALRELLISKELDPLSPSVHSAHGAFLYRARRYEEALKQLESTVKAFPDFANARREIAEVYGAFQDWTRAIASYRQALELRGNHLYWAGLGHALARSGATDEARRIAKELEAKLGVGHYSPASIAVVYRGLADYGRAFHWLDVALEQREPSITWIKADPANDVLRNDPRFQRVLEKLQL